MKQLIIVIFVTFAATAGLSGQDAKQKFAASQKENSLALRQYSWESRTRLDIDGETKNVSVDSIRYDIDGNQQKTQISATPESEPTGRRVKRRIIKKKKNT